MMMMMMVATALHKVGKVIQRGSGVCNCWAGLVVRVGGGSVAIVMLGYVCTGSGKPARDPLPGPNF